MIVIYTSHMDLNELAQDLTLKGWHLSPDLIPKDICEELLEQLIVYQQSTDSFSKAQIGQGADKKSRSEIRGDFIRWLEPAQPELNEKKFFSWFETFQQNLKQKLLLSLNEFELHYAFYPPHTNYEKHIDVFQQNSSRILSFVLYLNKDWQPSDGGELILFKEKNPDEEEVRISPHFGHLVVFLSSKIYHQVNFTNRERLSVTGWLKNSH
ncbi:2OG-Fe(II) oxygenase [bacterium]|nr:2OG-Fe(II) oxygenase [bacterium]